MRVIDVRSCLCRNRQRQAVWRLRTRSRWLCNYKSFYTLPHAVLHETRIALWKVPQDYRVSRGHLSHKAQPWFVRDSIAFQTSCSRHVRTLAVRRSLNKMHTRAADAPWMKHILIPRGYAVTYGHERKEMNGPEKPWRNATISILQHRTRVIQGVATGSDSIRWVSVSRWTPSVINIHLDTFIKI